MVMQAMHSGKGSFLLKWFFFALLIMAAAGLVLSDVGGFFRGGVGSNDVAKVGSKKISVVEFDRAARRALARMGMTPQQAYQLGYLNQVLNSEVRRSLFHQIAQEKGIMISRAEVAKQIDEMLEPMVTGDESKQEILDRVLMSQGFVESEFVNNVAAEASISVLSRAIQNPHLGQSAMLADDLYSYQNEQRSFEYITFLNSDIKDTEEPSDENLRQLYESVKGRLVIPESREITVGILKTEELENTIDISEEEIRGIYDDNIEFYNVPEQRFLKQAILTEQQQAQDIFEAVQNGTNLKKAVNDVTGSEDSFIDEQAFDKNGLVEEISNQVFAEEAPGAGTIYGPIESALGFHVLQLTKIEKPFTRSFESVQADIRQELLADELADQKFDIIAEVEDALAGGAAIEEVTQIIPIESIEIADVTSQGAFSQSNHPLDQFGDDQQIITDLTFEYFEGDSSTVTELSDGRLVFVTINKVTPQSFQPYEDVKEDLQKKWVRDQIRLDNRENVVELLNTSTTEEKSLKDIAEKEGKTIKQAKDIKRNQAVEQPLTNLSTQTIFSSSLAELVMFDVAGGFALGRVTSITFADNDNESDEFQTLQSNLERTSANEAATVYFENKQHDYNVDINNQVLERVYGSANTQ